MSNQPLKVGVLGAGMIASVNYGVLPNMKYVGDKATVVAIADPVFDRAKDVQREFDIPEVYPDLDEMLASSDLDAVVNLTPIPFHGSTSKKILEAGKHLATEKPIATTLEEADELIDIADSKGLTIVCSPPDMVLPVYRNALRLLSEGAIGQIAFARVRSSHGGPASGAWPNDPTWFYQKGSGPLLDMGVYGIHDITGLLGPAKRVVAFSGITEPVRTVQDGPFRGKKIEVTADDNALFMLDFGESKFAVIDGTYNVNASKSPRIEIFGRTGTLNINGHGSQDAIDLYQMDYETRTRGWLKPQLEWDEEADTIEKMQRAVLVNELADSVHEGRKSILSAEHARHALEIMLMVDESARTGKVIELQTTF